MNKASPLISILVGSKDRPPAIVRCLKSVLMQKYERFEIIVFDDNSKENLCDTIAQEFTDDRIKCFRSDINLGVAGGRNILIEKAKGDFIVTLDDDAAFRNNDSLKKMVALFNSFPDVGLFAFKIIDIIDDQENGFRVPFRKASVKRNPEIVNTSQYVGYFLGGGHAVKKEVYEKCGHYQEGLKFGVEELDLAYRIVENGYKMYYTPDIIVDHFPGNSSPLAQAARSEYPYYLMRNKIWINYKYLPWFTFLVSTVYWCLIRLVFSRHRERFFQVARGIKDGFKNLGNLKRNPLSKKAVAYLKRNNGRLFS